MQLSLLSNAQKVAIKNAILADPVLGQNPTQGDNPAAIRDAFNLTASPSFTVWKKSVTVTDIFKSPQFDWTRVDNLSVGKARIWEWMTMKGTQATAGLNPSEVNVRTGIDSVWVGTQADLNVKAAVYVLCKRLSLRWEAVAGVSTGTGSDVVPATMPAGLTDAELLTLDDVLAILAAS